MFKLEFTTGNEAFGMDTWDATLEAARVLEQVAQRLKEGYPFGSARDSNGNTIGQFTLTKET